MVSPIIVHPLSIVTLSDFDVNIRDVSMIPIPSGSLQQRKLYFEAFMLGPLKVNLGLRMKEGTLSDSGYTFPSSNLHSLVMYDDGFLIQSRLAHRSAAQVGNGLAGQCADHSQCLGSEASLHYPR